MDEPHIIKEVVWIGSSRKDVKAFPEAVQRVIGYALYAGQKGVKAPEAKVLSGFGGAGVLEIVDDYQGDTYRAVYTVKFADVVYVLHVFQKKSKKSSTTPKREIQLIKKRFSDAEEDYKTRKLRYGHDR